MAVACESAPAWAAQLMSIQVTGSVQGATASAEAMLKAAAEDPTNNIPEEGASQPPEESAPPTPIENLLANAFKDKKLPTEANSEFNRWWAKELTGNDTLKDNYKLLGKGYEVQRKFKIDWAGKRAEEMKEERTKTSEFRQVDGFKGEYLPLAIHVQKEGGDAMAFVAVQNYVKNVASYVAQGKTYKGRPWIVYDKMYCRVKFLRIDEYFDDSNTEAWSRTTRLLDGGASGPAVPPQSQVPSNTTGARRAEALAAPAAAAPPADATDLAEPPKKKPRGGPKAKLRAQPPAVEVDDHPPQTKSLKTAMAEAMKVKQKMEKTSTAASDLVQAIASQTEWHWANNDANLKELTKKQLALCKHKTKDKFWCEWTVQSDWSKKVKSMYSESFIESNLEEGIPAMQHAIDELNDVVTLLKEMHSARLKMKRTSD